jgi:hypothetical protein
MITTTKIKTPDPTFEEDRQPRNEKGRWTPPTTNKIKEPKFDPSKMKRAHPPHEGRLFLSSSMDFKKTPAATTPTKEEIAERPEKKTRGRKKS